MQPFDTESLPKTHCGTSPTSNCPYLQENVALSGTQPFGQTSVTSLPWVTSEPLKTSIPFEVSFPVAFSISTAGMKQFAERRGKDKLRKF